LPSRLHSDPM
ncbi:bacterial regulatory s, lacI family protein, partial [Vibrio harveyi]